MTTPVIPGSGREEFYGTHLRPEQTLMLVNAIIAGGQFSNTLSRVNSNAASIVFPVLSGVDEPLWTAELAAIPWLDLEGKPLVVAPTRLSGIVLISVESFRDGGLNITQQVQAGLQAKFSSVVDRDLLIGDGQAQTPAGLIPAAPAVSADSLWTAVIAAKAQISAAGGTPTHLAASPDVIAAEESRVDADDRPLWPDGLATYAGVQVVPTPAATTPLVYDRAKVHLVVRSDYEALTSEHVTPAFERYGLALRLTCRMAAACPAPVMAMRRLVIDGELVERGGQARSKPKPTA